MRKSWEITGKSWEIPEKVQRKSKESTEKVMRKSQHFHKKVPRKFQKKVLIKARESPEKAIRKSKGTPKKHLRSSWESPGNVLLTWTSLISANNHSNRQPNNHPNNRAIQISSVGLGGLEFGNYWNKNQYGKKTSQELRKAALRVARLSWC